MENDAILNDKKDIYDTCNSFLLFVNVANDISKGIIFDENNNPSIDRIRTIAPKTTLILISNQHNTDTVTNLFNKMNIKKATSVAQISYKTLKAGAPILNKHIATPKEAQVVPLYK